MNNPRETWHITITPLASSVPVACRIRRLLKYALRALRLRCVAVHGEQQYVSEAIETSEQKR